MLCGGKHLLNIMGHHFTMVKLGNVINTLLVLLLIVSHFTLLCVIVYHVWQIFSPSNSTTQSASSIRSPMSLSSSTCSSPGSSSPVGSTGQKFCVCKAQLTPTQHGDIQCDLCRQTFHSMCVGQAPNVPYTCEPCKQKHNSARSSCLCGKCDDDIKQNWISCDVCQTWYHQKCVGIDERAEQQEYICPKVLLTVV